MSTVPLIPEQRQQRLLALLRRDGVMSIRELTDLLLVSHMTVRRDIQALEADGQVSSVPGGVRIAGTVPRVPPSGRAQRADLEIPRKRSIGRTAAELVEDGMTVFLDAGTTCQCLAEELIGREGLTVVTNDFFVVTSLLGVVDWDVLHTGGTVDAESGSSMGDLAVRTLERINLDIAFISTGTWGSARGVTTPLLPKVSLKEAAMRAAAVGVLVADSTKYGTASRFLVCPVEQFDVVVSDSELPTDARHSLIDHGVDLRLAAV